MRRGLDFPNYVHVNLEKPLTDFIIGHKIPQGFTGIATFNMKVESEYLFVGDGRQDYCTHYQEAYYTFFKSKDQLAVPGTSLKGAVRSVAEAISASCVSVRSGRDYQELREYPACSVRKGTRNIRICPACRIFGTTNYRGHFSFSDALPDSDIEPEIIKIAELWRPKILVPGRKFYKSGQYMELEDQEPEKNYRYIEVVPKGSVFAFDLIFENAQESDLSLVFHSMGINQSFDIKVGGANPRCLGNVSFVAKKIVTMDCLTYSEHKDPENFLRNSMMNKKLIKPEKLEELAKKISSTAACSGGLSQWN